jgi:hypothetical protein
MPKFKFTKVFESYWDLEIDAEDFQQALTIANVMNEDNEWEEDDGGEAQLEWSRCRTYEDEEALEDFNETEELEWYPE